MLSYANRALKCCHLSFLKNGYKFCFSHWQRQECGISYSTTEKSPCSMLSRWVDCPNTSQRCFTKASRVCTTGLFCFQMVWAYCSTWSVNREIMYVILARLVGNLWGCVSNCSKHCSKNSLHSNRPENTAGGAIRLAWILTVEEAGCSACWKTWTSSRSAASALTVAPATASIFGCVLVFCSKTDRKCNSECCCAVY